MTQADSQPIAVSLPIAWMALQETPAVFANVFVVEVVEDDVVFNAGHAGLPLLPETMSEEERRSAIESMSFVPARTVVRLALNRRRLLDMKAAVERGLELLEVQRDRRTE